MLGFTLLSTEERLEGLLKCIIGTSIMVSIYFGRRTPAVNRLLLEIRCFRAWFLACSALSLSTLYTDGALKRITHVR